MRYTHKGKLYGAAVACSCRLVLFRPTVICAAGEGYVGFGFVSKHSPVWSYRVSIRFCYNENLLIEMITALKALSLLAEETSLFLKLRQVDLGRGSSRIAKPPNPPPPHPIENAA
jgi:hypothetical protein